MIKTLLAPYEVYIWAAVAFLLLCGGIYTVHRLENIGVQRQQAADAKLAAAQAIHKEEVEARAQQLTQTAGGVLHTALVAPDPKPTFTVRVCPAGPTSGLIVPADVSPVTGESGVNTGSPGVGSGGASQGVDIAPITEGILGRQDAEIAYWRTYYATCKAQGICK